MTMVRKKGSSKSTSKKVVKAKNSHHKNVLESVFGPPKRATLKQTIEPPQLQSSSSKHTMKLRNDYSKKTKPKRNQLAAAVSSASAVDKADPDCLLELQTTMEEPQVITRPFWDFVSLPAKPASVHAVNSDKLPSLVRRIP